MRLARGLRRLVHPGHRLMLMLGLRRRLLLRRRLILHLLLIWRLGLFLRRRRSVLVLRVLFAALLGSRRDQGTQQQQPQAWILGVHVAAS